MLIKLSVVLVTLVTRGLCNNILTSPVETEGGRVVGLQLSTLPNDIPYFSFRGIPYAEPPVGNSRFKPSQPKLPWSDVLYALNDKEKCLQMNNGQVSGSEDCLYLNVYTPNTNIYGGLKPTIVWIHGGAFTTGNGNSSYYGPDFLLEEEIVVVSIQYRLGPLGFLNVNHPSASGNNGLKDQNLALKWIQRNIRNFGGDPNKVTLMGQSAGGVAVDLHKLSNMSAGLFQHTISMSASPLCTYWAFQSYEEAEEHAYSLGSKFGVKSRDADALVKKLLEVPAEEIIQKSSELPMIPFRPTLERADVAPEEPKFITVCPPKKYYDGNYNKGPHMMGYTSAEILSMSSTLDDLIKWHKGAAQSIKRYKIAKIFPTTSEILAIKFEAIATLKRKAFSNLIKRLSDIYFVSGIDMTQQLLAKTNEAPVYYYRYDFKSPESAHKSEGITILDGVAHEDELPYIFHRPHLKMSFRDPEIARNRDRLVRMWTNFARYGDPTPFGAEDGRLDGVTWPDSGKDGAHLEINGNLTIVKTRRTNPLITLYQKLNFGDSNIYKNCNQSVVSDIISGVMNIPVAVVEIISHFKKYFG